MSYIDYKVPYVVYKISLITFRKYFATGNGDWLEKHNNFEKVGKLDARISHQNSFRKHENSV